MARITMTEQQDFSVAPIDSILLLKIEEVSVQTVTGGARGDWQKLNFKFKILDTLAIGDGSPKSAYADLIDGPIYGSVPFKLTTHPENKLRQWVEAIFGMELPEGFELDTDLLEKKVVRGITSQYKTKKTDSAGNPFTRHQVESLLPYGSAPAGSAPPAAKPDPWAAEAAQATTTPSTSAGFAYSDEPPF